MKLNISVLLIAFLFALSGCGGGSGSGETSDKTPDDTTTQPPITIVDDTAPNFTSNPSITMQENNVMVTIVHANDNATVTYSIASGGDASNFAIYRTSGQLRFKTGPNFEIPTDAGADNNYTVTVTATDSSNNQAQQQISVIITDIDETSSDDADDDNIPDNIEILINSNLSNSDENANGIPDGVDIEGIHGDTFFDKQWHIRSLGTTTNDSGIETIPGNDLNLLELYHHYMGYNKGNNIIVQVVDTGVDADHEDLAENMDLSRSYDGESVGDPSGSHSHGTMVAGIMAARAFNGKGVRGIIPFAKIAGSNWLDTQEASELEKVWLTGDGANEIAVSNNSWGAYFNTDTLYEDIMKIGTSTLRDGKGRIYVFAAGNDRKDNGNANLQYLLNHRYSIAVAALRHNNTYAEYSTPGSNILVSGYSGNYYYDSPTISTTTIMGNSSNTGNIQTKTTWSEDTNENYTFTMNGTSSASPTVAASIALVLEACPDLTWRDIKYLTATHAKQVDIGNSPWVTNAAGLKHSIDYGFGLINAQGMIDTCTATNPSYNKLTDELNITKATTFNIEIEDNNTPHSFDINITESIIVEWVEIILDNDSSSASDYKVELTSPQGTQITLMTERTDVPVSGNWMEGGFRLSTPAMIDESSDGNWTIDITDTWSGDTGTLKDIELKIYGH